MARTRGVSVGVKVTTTRPYMIVPKSFLSFCESGLGNMRIGSFGISRKIITGITVSMVIVAGSLLIGGCGSSSNNSSGTTGAKVVNLLSWGGTIQQTFAQ